MRYIDPTLPQDKEPTYNNFQIVSGIITSAGIAGIIVFAISSFISSI